MKFWQRLSVERFNRLCLWLGALWLIVTIPLGIILRPTVPDFGQFYIGGLLARTGQWHALYPVPDPRSRDNAGLNIHSRCKPEWRALCKERNVPDYTHFILPPPSALVFAPFSFLSYSKAFWLWTAMLSACAWGVASVATLLYRELAGKPSRVEGVLALLVILSPVTARAIRIANVSPFIALSIGLALLALLRGAQPVRCALAITGGAILKYATLVLLPLLVAMRRWRTIFYVAAFGAAALLVTFAVAGAEPFVEFYESILPTLSRPSRYRGNQTFSGMLARIFGRPFTPELSFVVNGLRAVTLAACLALILSRGPRRWKMPENVLAGAGLLLSWLLVFSPIAWEHWPVFLCPVWGWLLWEAGRPGARRIVAVLSLLLMYFPAGILQVRGIAHYNLLLPEPYNSTQLIGVSLLGLLAFWRLKQTSDRANNREGVEPGKSKAGRSAPAQA